MVGLVGWVLWHINLCRLFNAKFCLHVYTFNLRFLNEYFEGNIFDKQNFICLHTINRFQFVIFFGTTLSLARRTEPHQFWRSRIDRLNFEKSLSEESESSTFSENVFNGARRLTGQTLWLFGLFWFGLLGFMAYQPLMGYFMPNPVYKNIWIVSA